MANYNRVVLMGNLTRDPELRTTPNGTPVAEFGLAVNRTWKDRDGEKHEDTCFVGLVAWAGQAEVLCEYVGKGDPLFAEGRLQMDEWTDKATGAKRSKLKVVVEGFQFLPRGRRNRDADDARAPGGGEDKGPRPETPPAPAAPPATGHHIPDEDIPF